MPIPASDRPCSVLADSMIDMAYRGETSGARSGIFVNYRVGDCEQVAALIARILEDRFSCGGAVPVLSSAGWCRVDVSLPPAPPGGVFWLAPRPATGPLPAGLPSTPAACSLRRARLIAALRSRSSGQDLETEAVQPPSRLTRGAVDQDSLAVLGRAWANRPCPQAQRTAATVTPRAARLPQRRRRRRSARSAAVTGLRL
jgi:hypothetical protein